MVCTCFGISLNLCFLKNAIVETFPYLKLYILCLHFLKLLRFTIRYYTICTYILSEYFLQRMDHILQIFAYKKYYTSLFWLRVLKIPASNNFLKIIWYLNPFTEKFLSTSHFMCICIFACKYIFEQEKL